MEPRFVPQARREPVRHTVQDRAWAGDARAAAGCGGLLLVLSLTVDAGYGGLTPGGAVLWIVLSVALFVILLPARVTAAPGLVTVRHLWSSRTVRTDRLTAVRWPDGIEQRLVLRDADGGRARIELRVLLANPALWLLVESGARASAADGTLRSGAACVDRLARRVEREAARSVFSVSGLG
ncbi:hypothetical protein [Streptomyces sp. NPDC050504]|uniref:hypothetical protein n=1 Tax=Streptomyces sp. NPDC050504 TaxID=3365618 RepID=UPI0037BCC5ED